MHRRLIQFHQGLTKARLEHDQMALGVFHWLCIEDWYSSTNYRHVSCCQVWRVRTIWSLTSPHQEALRSSYGQSIHIREKLKKSIITNDTIHCNTLYKTLEYTSRFNKSEPNFSYKQFGLLFIEPQCNSFEIDKLTIILSVNYGISIS